MKNSNILYIVIIASFFFGCNNKVEFSSYGYFDNDDFYNEIHIEDDTIFFCNSALPKIYAYNYSRVDGRMEVFEYTEKIADISIADTNIDSIFITINNDVYRAYLIESDSVNFYYYSKQRKMLDDFTRKITFREQKVRASLK